MGALRIDGGVPLHGEVPAGYSKNNSLALMAGTLLLDGESVLEDLPRVTDIEAFRAIMGDLGVLTEWIGPHRLRVVNAGLLPVTPPADRMRRLRASIYVMGPLLARHGRAAVPLPGGCRIGARPIDLHLRAFAALGARTWIANGCASARVPRGLRGAAMQLLGPHGTSVGATINAVLAAAVTPGVTQIHGAAREPEVAELAIMLNRAGARIIGAGTGSMEIEGVPWLGGVSHRVPADRIAAGTVLLAAAATGGDVTVTGLPPGHLTSLLFVLTEMGCRVETDPATVRVAAPNRLRPVSAATAPFPGLATDLQPPLTAALALADGVSVISETVFNGRFGWLAELERFGARVRERGGRAVVTGVPALSGAPAAACDLRAGAALVVAGLAARGETVVDGTEYLERGYEDLAGALRRLGARIDRLSAVPLERTYV